MTRCDERCVPRSGDIAHNVQELTVTCESAPEWVGKSADESGAFRAYCLSGSPVTFADFERESVRSPQRSRSQSAMAIAREDSRAGTAVFAGRCCKHPNG